MLLGMVILFPACAGVILADSLHGEYAKTVPRMRGGDPVVKACY